MQPGSKISAIFKLIHIYFYGTGYRSENRTASKRPSALNRELTVRILTPSLSFLLTLVWKSGIWRAATAWISIATI